jgi:hypothetical protein
MLYDFCHLYNKGNVMVINLVQDPDPDPDPNPNYNKDLDRIHNTGLPVLMQMKYWVVFADPKRQSLA